MPKDVFAHSSEELQPEIELSVCIPAYNRPIWLGRALRSVVAASQWHTLEIIVSDDSSSEACEQITQEILSPWPGIWHYTHNHPSLGMAGNWNHAASLASGHYVLILHDDDFVLPGGIDIIIHHIRTYGSRSVPFLFGVRLVNAQEELIKHQKPGKTHYLSPEQALPQVLSHSSFIRFPAIVISRACFQTYGYFNTEIGSIADLEMWIRLLSQVGLYCFPHSTCAYTIHEGALTTKMFQEEVIQGILQQFQRVHQAGLLNHKILEHYQSQYFHQFILAGTYRSLRQGDLESAVRVIGLFQIDAIKSLPLSLRWLGIRLIFKTITTAYTTLESLKGTRQGV